MKSEKGPTKRQLQAAATRRHIYETAMRLMEERGSTEVTITDIAKEAGVSIGAFYHYFESKDAVFFETYGLADDYFLEQVVPNLTGKTIAERIAQYFGFYARFNAERGVAHTQLLYNPHNKHFVDTGRFMISAFRTLVHEGITRGEIKIHWSAEEITEFFFIAARGLVYDWCLHDGSYDLEQKMSRVIAQLAKSIVSR